MPTPCFRRFAAVESLRCVSTKYIVAWLSSNGSIKDYLERRGFVLPNNSDGELNHELLSSILIDPDSDMPPSLVEDMWLMHEMATEPIMLELMEISPPGLLERSPADPTPGDVAIQLLLKDRKLLERKRAEQFLHRSRSFRLCQGNGTQKELPQGTGVEQSLISLALDEWFFEHRRGRKCRVSFFRRLTEGQLWILIQRGAAMRLQDTFDNGQSSSLLFRPGAFDLIVYHLEQDVLVTHTDTDTKGELELYRKTIGKHLFGDENYFTSEGRHTLKPLMEHRSAALNCDGIAGIEWVHVRELEIYSGKGRGMFVRVKADDVFTSMDESHMILPKGLVTKAVFLVKFADSEKPRSVTIFPPSRDRYERDDDRAVMEPFWKRNSFVLGISEQADEAA